MLAFSPSLQAGYDFALTLVALLLAVVMATVGFSIALLPWFADAHS